MSAKSTSGRTPMTSEAASRIQSTTARQHGGQTPAGSFSARAQRAAAMQHKHALSLPDRRVLQAEAVRKVTKGLTALG